MSDSNEPAPRPQRMTVRERELERREAKLDDVQRQVESGSLTIRKMTPDELRRYGPAPPPGEGRRGRNGGRRGS